MLIKYHVPLDDEHLDYEISLLYALHPNPKVCPQSRAVNDAFFKGLKEQIACS
jgi:hypothetical protein